VERWRELPDLALPWTSCTATAGDIGLRVELEMFPVWLADLHLLPPHVSAGPDGLLARLAAQEGWRPHLAADQVVALTRDAEQVTLRPGGVLAYTTPWCTTLWEVAPALDAFLASVTMAAQPLGVGLLPLGYHPYAVPDAGPAGPASAYHRGEAMQQLTAGLHITLALASAAETMRTLQLASKLTPFLLALSANSAVQAGRETGRASTRAYAWMGLDPARAGFPDWIFHPQARLADYRAWALAAPLAGLERDGAILGVTPVSFQAFRHSGLALPSGQGYTYATQADWQRHLRTLMPWARLQHGVEIRACESQAPELALALGALVKGLCASPRARQVVETLVGAYDEDRLAHLLQHATLYGLEADVDGLAFRDMLGLLLDVAHESLRASGDQEECWLTPARLLLSTRSTPASGARTAWDLEQSLRSHLLLPTMLQTTTVCQGALA